MWRVRTACWIRKATKTHSEYVIVIAFPRQLRLRERASILHLYLLCLSGVSFSALCTSITKIYTYKWEHNGRVVLSVTLLFCFLMLYVTVRYWHVYLTALWIDKIIQNLCWCVKYESSNDTDRAKPKSSDGNLPFYHFDYHKSHTDGGVMVPVSPQLDVDL